MSLGRFLTAFAHLRKETVADGLGGTEVTWVQESVFQGEVTARVAEEVTPGGRMAARCRTRLLHLPGVVLYPGDRVLRCGDGAVWEVLTCSEDMTMPRKGGFSQVAVERVVYGR